MSEPPDIVQVFDERVFDRMGVGTRRATKRDQLTVKQPSGRTVDLPSGWAVANRTVDEGLGPR